MKTFITKDYSRDQGAKYGIRVSLGFNIGILSFGVQFSREWRHAGVSEHDCYRIVNDDRLIRGNVTQGLRAPLAVLDRERGQLQKLCASDPARMKLLLHQADQTLLNRKLGLGLIRPPARLPSRTMPWSVRVLETSFGSRVCKFPGCNQKLFSWSRDDKCFIHSNRLFKSSLIRKTAISPGVVHAPNNTKICKYPGCYSTLPIWTMNKLCPQHRLLQDLKKATTTSSLRGLEAFQKSRKCKLAGCDRRVFLWTKREYCEIHSIVLPRLTTIGSTRRK